MSGALLLATGLLGSGLLIASSLQLERRRLLALLTAALAVYAVQYGLFGAWAAMATSSVALARNAWALRRELRASGEGSARPVLEAACWMLAVVAAWALGAGPVHSLTAWDLVPVASNALTTAAVLVPRVLATKLPMMGAGSMWLLYQWRVGAWGLMLGEAVVLAGNGVSAARLVSKACRSRRRLDAEDMDEEMALTKDRS